MTITDRVTGVLACFTVYAVLSVLGVGVSSASAQDISPCTTSAPVCAQGQAYNAAFSYWAAKECSAGNSVHVGDPYIYILDHYNNRWKGTITCYRATDNFTYTNSDFATWFFYGCPPGTSWSDVTHTCAAPPLYNLNKSLGPQCDFPSEGKSKPKLMCGNPINVAIGNKYQVESDFTLTPLFAFSRYYNSIAIGRSDLLGPQWSHTYARNVAVTGAGTANPVATITRPEGNRVTFTLTAGVWTADGDVIASLVRHDDPQGALLGWTYTPQDGREVEQYDALGRLLQITKSDGSAINLTYNNGVIENNANDLRLTQVQAQDGRSLVFTYDTSNRIHQITDPSGGVYLYGYDTSDRLSTVTYPGGAQRNYLYNEPAFTGGASLPNALTGIVHEDWQRFATFNYQADGRAISTEHAGAVEKFAVQYNADGTSTVTTPLGTTQQRTFSTVLGVKKVTAIVETCADCSP
jgi:YD repeat-containing protein